MGFVVLHINKASGNDAAMTAHIERTIDPKNADQSRTHLNKDLITYPAGVENRTQAIQHRLDNAGLTRKIGTNQVRALRIMLSGTPEDMQRIEAAGKLDQWCEDNLDWLRKTYGANNVVSAVLHMDEKTPHIHATVVPIVTGERRKAAQTKSAEPDKKKYRKKNPNAARLCTDDVMARPKLKMYQDTYAEAMAKYGLQRGIDGSEARHISNHEFYRDITANKEALQNDIENLQETKEVRRHEVMELEQQELHARSRTEQAVAEKQQAETELIGKQSELQKIKGELKTEKFKGVAADAGSAIMDGISSALGTSKVKRQQEEIESLKVENQTLRGEITSLNQTISRERKESDKVVNELKDELNQIYEWLPNTPQLVKWGEYCQNIGFTNAQAKDLINMKPIQFTGELHSKEHYQKFKVNDAEVCIEKSAGNSGGFRLLINKVNIFQWFRQKYQELKQAVRPNISSVPKPETNKGKGIKR